MVQKVSFSIQLLCGLTYLSDLAPPAVHRDIKPDNIFVKGGSCVLGDFGLLKHLDGHYEEDREILKESLGPGMPKYYRTPDLVDYYNDVSLITAKSDDFQLGLVLAKLFTGWNPDTWFLSDRAEEFKYQVWRIGVFSKRMVPCWVPLRSTQPTCYGDPVSWPAFAFELQTFYKIYTKGTTCNQTEIM